ncbi:hypothetical protein [Maritimibacter dapengensis]|uniref:Uncharacterized protein n=1 Tax=Maritimibacter dapengensis TaxID=2836868 RepID=A0ABS6T1P8_9RHOB|nr:hypothetical protein [Maritimibacter dapengensis]MBV7379176.1 hypothetical protein [Maritimibacter dapengensis]
MREVDAIAVASEHFLDDLAALFELVHRAVEFHEQLVFLKAPLPFDRVLAMLEQIGLEVVGAATLLGEAGEPSGPVRTVFAQSEVPLAVPDIPAQPVARAG